MNEKKIDLSDLNMTDEELFAPVNHDELESERITAPRYSYWHSVFRVFFKKKINIVLLLILAVLLLFTYVYPVIIHYDAEVDPYINLMDSTAKHLGPKAAMAKFGNNIHWIFGSGSAGQSTFDAVWYGSSISVSLALVCALINMTVGVVIGAVWGFSKKVDLFMTEVYNVVANIPSILLISVIVLIMSASFWTMVFALTITGWIGIAYFIRTQVIIIRDREYNLASRCLGTPITRIASKNILPFMTSVIVTLAAAEIHVVAVEDHVIEQAHVPGQADRGIPERHADPRLGDRILDACGRRLHHHRRAVCGWSESGRRFRPQNPYVRGGANG